MDNHVRVFFIENIQVAAEVREDTPFALVEPFAMIISSGKTGQIGCSEMQPLILFSDENPAVLETDKKQIPSYHANKSLTAMYWNRRHEIRAARSGIALIRGAGN